MFTSTLLAFASAIALHALAVRLVKRVGRVAQFLLVGSVVGVALIAYLVEQYGASAETIALCIIYAALCEGYIFLFTLLLGSISANVVYFLRKGPTKVAELEQLYAGQNMAALRINRLQDVSLLDKSAEGWTLTRRGRFVLKAYRVARAFFCHDTTTG